MSQLPNAVWLPGILTGGLAGAGLTSAANWIMSWCSARKAQRLRLNALKQELRHALWTIGYNHDRIADLHLLHKGLARIATSNTERVLFEGAMSIPLPDAIPDQLLAYFEEVVYHNSLIDEYQALLPTAFLDEKAKDRLVKCMNEIGAICRLEATPPLCVALPSLRARAKSLLQELDGIKVVWWAWRPQNRFASQR